MVPGATRSGEVEDRHPGRTQRRDGRLDLGPVVVVVVGAWTVMVLTMLVTWFQGAILTVCGR